MGEVVAASILEPEVLVKVEETPSFPTPWDPLDPLPDYTRSWGPHLRRPSKLPELYDTRIDPAHIFVFSVHPITGIERDFYVTPKPCEYCAKIRQVCSRSRPFCQRCAVAAGSRTTCKSEEGWVKLPGPKCVKPKLQKSSRKAIVKPVVETSVERTDTPSQKISPSIAPTPTRETGSDTLPSRAPSPIPPQDPPSRKPRAKRARLTESSAPGKASDDHKNVPTKPINVAVQKRSAPKSRRVSRRLTSGKREFKDGTWEGTDKTVWNTIRPPSPPPPADLEGPKSMRGLLNAEQNPDPPERPRIWASSKSELLEILPELSKALSANGSGIFREDMALEPPLIFLEGGAWPEDKCDLEGLMELSFVSEFFRPQGMSSDENAMSIDHDIGSFDMNLIEQPVSHTASANQDTPLPEAEKVTSERATPSYLHPSEALKRKRESSSNSVSPLSHNIPLAVEPTPAPRPSQLYSHTQPPSHLASSTSVSLHGRFGKQLPKLDLHPIPPFNASYSLPPPPPHSVEEACLLAVQQHGLFANMKCSFRLPQITDDSRSAGHLGVGNANMTHNSLMLKPASFVGEELPTAASDGSEEMSSLDGHTRETSPLTSLSALSPPQRPSSRSVVSPIEKHADDAMGLLSNNLTQMISGLSRCVPPDIRDSIDDLGMPEERHRSLDIPRERKATWNRAIQVPSEVPPEIERLQECQSYGIPVSVVMSQNSSLLPITLDKQYGVVYLGFFKIMDKQETILSSEVEPDGSVTAKVRWRYILQWIPGGDVPTSQGSQPLHAWWSDTCGQGGAKSSEPSPYSLLPMQLSSEFSKHVTVASEVNTRTGWHCEGCGRLNVQHNLCFQLCGTCGANNGVSGVGAMYVRDPHKMTPDSRPIDTYPDGVFCQTFTPDKDGMSTFLYALNRKACIKHIFTCNRSSCQKLPNQLFYDIQMHVPLTWQHAQTKLASGPYFNCIVGPGHENNAPSMPWDQVPPCLLKARDLMKTMGVRDGLEKEFDVEQLTIVAWHTAGNRKGPPIAASTQTIAILCLGADVELNVTPKGGFQDMTSTNVRGTHDASFAGPADPTHVSHDDFEVIDPMDLDEEDVPLSSLYPAQPSSAPINVSAGKASKKRAKPMFITLVHGDMLMLSGDDFEYSTHRTGMGILLIGSPGTITRS